MGDVARLAHVSKATVSAVLNGRGSVKASTRTRVLEAIALLNYRAEPALGGTTRTRGARSLGLVIKEMDNSYYAEVMLGARTVAEAHGYTLLVASSEGEYDAERHAVDLLRAQGTDGLIITPVLDESADLTHLFELKRRNFPFVLLEEVLGVRASLVDVENDEASRQAAEHLIKRGHRRIIHFAGPKYSMHRRERIDGVRRACAESNIVFSDDQIVGAGAHLEDGYRAGIEYFSNRAPAERATAVTCYNDLVAIGLFRALTELGLRVPEDVSIVGFDDIPLAEYLPVPLTTIRIPKTQVGAIAAEMLIQHAESHAALPPQRASIESELIIRASVCSVDPSRDR